MSAARTYVAECDLCHTKFEDNPGECPVCGNASLREIREAVKAVEEIPVPTKRTAPPRAMRRRRAAAGPHRAFEGSKVRRFKGPAASTGTDVPAGAMTGIRFTGVGSEKKPGLPARGPDGRFLPRKKAGGGTAAAAGRADCEPLRTGTGGARTIIRIDVADAARRLEAAKAELREARRASFAAARRKILAESAVRRIQREIQRAFGGKDGRTGGLHAVLRTLGKLFSAILAAMVWK